MFRVHAPSLLAGSLLAIAATSIGAEPAPTSEPATSELREAVIAAATAREKGKAYRAYFLRVGSDGLEDAMQDKDVGIALQAAWEIHTIPAQRKAPAGPRTNDVYDPVELAKFVAFFEDRTKAPVPEWWAIAIADVDLFPGRHHAFIGSQKDLPRRPIDGEEREPEFQIEKNDSSLVCTGGDRSIKISRDTFRSADAFAGLFQENRWIVAGYSNAGFGYRAAAFESERPEPSWISYVWGAGRTILAGSGYHHVDLREENGVVYLFGMESHGAYVEAFDAETGKLRFRFCSCYWFDHSEAWGLK